MVRLSILLFNKFFNLSSSSLSAFLSIWLSTLLNLSRTLFRKSLKSFFKSLRAFFSSSSLSSSIGELDIVVVTEGAPLSLSRASSLSSRSLIFFISLSKSFLTSSTSFLVPLSSELSASIVFDTSLKLLLRSFLSSSIFFSKAVNPLKLSIVYLNSQLKLEMSDLHCSSKCCSCAVYRKSLCRNSQNDKKFHNFLEGVTTKAINFL